MRYGGIKMAGGTKEYNKTILQTSFTSLEYIYYLLKVVENNQPMTSANGKDKIFPVARARIAQERGGEWSEDKRDTHAELTLREMKFIRYVDSECTMFEVSDVGHTFLDAFTLVEEPTESEKVKLSLQDKLSIDEKNQLLLDILIRINVEQERFGRNLRPYLILFKLLSEPKLEGYITKSEWACFINSSEYLHDTQYPQIRDRLIAVREKDENHAPKKSDRILTRLVLWKVLNKVDIPYEDEGCFAFNDDFAKVVEINMLQGQVNSLIGENQVKSNSVRLELPNEDERNTDGENVLLYGVPGSGKSWTINHEYCDNDELMERLVFYPDYMYSDFVGQILPVVRDDKVRYEFVPGPFVKILKKAYWNPTKSYCLVIEEINRGNAPAIFGEVFQLLDRKSKDSDGFRRGTSEYGITNANIAREVYGNENSKVRIPGNLSIIGTMNTSDQNVFTLDTAFQRRWVMRMIPNSFEDHGFAGNHILDTDVSWQQFCDAINDEILRRNNITSSEDKRLGAYFVTEEDLILHDIPEGVSGVEKKRIERYNARFAEKVIKYLWDDAFKFSHAETFDTRTYNSLERVIEGFMKAQGNNRFRVYHENLRKMIFEGKQQDSNIVAGEVDSSDK